MKSEPYRQFIDRNSCDISDCIRLFHELNHLYDNQLILSLDSRHWEIFDLRTSRSIARIEFKHIKELRHFISTLIHDILLSDFIIHVIEDKRNWVVLPTVRLRDY